MSWKLSTALAGAFIASGCAAAQAANEADTEQVAEGSSRELTCEYPVKVDDSAESLIARYGEQARLGQYWGEAEEFFVLTIWPDDPSRTLEIVYRTEERKEVRSVGAGPESRWTIKGLPRGASVERIEEVNGASFAMFGFEWDMHGRIVDFNGGTLADLGGCRAKLSMDYRELGEDEGDLNREELMGDIVIPSTAPAMRSGDIQLSYLALQFGEDPELEGFDPEDY
ncbi:hypothetical protein ACI5KX_06815 [Erythrobacter sp. GH1-10]|uniref:hypothetical protein n=1 Tax=Erythrobacter sp. GH1-10 TaxID=3349334 RepID=UPI003877C581